MRLIVACAALIAGCAADDDARHAAPVERTVDTASCTQLRDHLIDLRLTPDQVGAAATPSDLAQLRAGLVGVMGDDFLARCQAELSSPQLTCSLTATTSAAAAACTGGAS